MPHRPNPRLVSRAPVPSCDGGNAYVRRLEGIPGREDTVGRNSRTAENLSLNRPYGKATEIVRQHPQYKNWPESDNAKGTLGEAIEILFSVYGPASTIAKALEEKLSKDKLRRLKGRIQSWQDIIDNMQALILMILTGFLKDARFYPAVLF